MMGLAIHGVNVHGNRETTLGPSTSSNYSAVYKNKDKNPVIELVSIDTHSCADKHCLEAHERKYINMCIKGG